MALSRRFSQRATDNIWPGFVDAMTALLLVLMFVLTIFMVIQSVLSERILDQDTELDELTLQLSDLADALGMERSRAEELTGEVGQLTATLDEARSDAAAQQALIATLTATVSTQKAEIASQGAEIANQTARITGFEDQVAALLSRTGELESQAAQLGDTLAASEEEREALQAALAETESDRDQAQSETEALNLALAKLRTEVDAEAESARLAAARAEAFESLVKDLETRNADREGRLATLLAQLEQADKTAAERAAELEEQSAAAAALQENLATALSELSEAEGARLAELAAAEALKARLSENETALTEAEKTRLAELAAAEALRERLKNADAELTAMTLALEGRRREAEETLTLLAAEQAARSRLEGDLDSLRTEREALTGDLSEAEKAAALLAVANAELEKFEAQSAEDARRVALLNEQVAALRTQLGGLQSMLDDATAKDVEAQVQIQALGSQLNTALARVASEQRTRADLEEAERRRLEAESEVLKADAEQLAQFRSEFFGRLRDLLGGQEGVRIEGDRFVFSSEVLFDRGEVALSLQGRQEVAKVAAILRRIAGEIPAELDWVIRVDGHTDDIPVTGGRFRDNWELSQGRALSVVRYMINQLGIPPDRLVAAGFGEFNPLNTADTEEARAQNRRIELKFTEK